MKLPRWLVIVMLTFNVLAVLTAVGLCWVTWPERTARALVDLIAARRFDEAKTILREDPDYLRPCFWESHPSAHWATAKLRNRPRTTLEILQARGVFDVTYDDVAWGLEIRLIVQHGEVIAWEIK